MVTDQVSVNSSFPIHSRIDQEKFIFFQHFGCLGVYTNTPLEISEIVDVEQS